MKNKTTNQIMEAIAGSLEIPPSAYEKAESRYNNLGEWLEDKKSASSEYSPHIYSQGSFRLGTVIRPVDSSESYDLDLGCRLQSGVSKQTHTQEQLKKLIGVDLEAYRRANGIQHELEEKHRCWRLDYLDELNFHIDVVPSIPEDETQIASLQGAMTSQGFVDTLANTVASHAGSITDNRHPSYRSISGDWRISNSEGYALWFESRLKQAEQLLKRRALEASVATVEDLPAWRWKTPLQQSIQILKRHRDIMYKDDPDGKPISIILTTLAASAYQGEDILEDALERILTD
ncbi:MAG: nucleotidyltransferase, partial [Cyanobacteria bacterium J06656_5]